MNDTTYLKILRPITEADGRNLGKKGYRGATDQGPGGVINAYDWRLWSMAGFGRRLQGMLSPSNSCSYEVTDFGQYVTVRGTYHDLAKGQSRSKTFVIAFDDPKAGDGKIFATSTKWRTFSTPDQAANYVKSTVQSLS